MNDRSQSKKKQPDRDIETHSDPIPSVGPHGKPELTNSDATPGAGSLPQDKLDGDADAGTG